MSVRKALLIGINYVGSQNQLNGCHSDVNNMVQFIRSQGYRDEDMVVLMDRNDWDPNGRHWPTGENIMRAIHWLVDTENGSLFLHYSGHGGRMMDQDGGGMDDTICPVDFQENGQIDSDVLHRALVTPLHDSSQLHAIFDCCHSGSAIELPYTYRTDEYGNVSMVDNIKAGIQLATGAARLFQGGISPNSLREAQDLYAGAQSFFKSLQHQTGGQEQEGLGQADSQDYAGENRRVVMFSGCRDDQTSADASIGGAATGAMSWAFLEVMKHNDGRQSYVEILKNTRGLLQQQYSQVPQLSAGMEMDLNDPFRI